MNDDRYKKFFDIDSLIKNIKKYLPDFDTKLFKKAFEFAANAHEGQMRKDGKTPYVAHPVNVVEILSNLHANQPILIAAILHDVPEDTKFGLDEITKQFGEDVASLVSGITKLSKVHYQHDMPQRQIESLKKLFLSSAKDPRVILIKLADRLHNMRTLNFVDKPEKRLRIARETLEIFVPMANLLGLQEIKSELEDMSFKYLFPVEYKRLGDLFEQKYEKNKNAKDESISKLKQAMEKAKINAKIAEKKQNLYTIYKKLLSKGKAIDDFEYRALIRIIVETIPKCYEVLGVVHNLFTPKTGRFKDYIAQPKVNNYQSLHTRVFGQQGALIEVQIRTEDMHLNAVYGIAASFFLNKDGEISGDSRSDWLNKIAELQKNPDLADNFLENLKVDILQDRISVFTPKGGKIDLPKGASAIDFAYVIHSEIGNHALKADINGDIVPISTVLNTGDVVGVIKDDAAIPHLSWLSFTKTNLAKNKIRLFLKKADRDKKIEDGQKILQREFDIAGLGLVRNMSFRKINKRLLYNLGRSFHNLSDLLISLGEGEIKAADIVKAISKGTKIFGQDITLNIKIVAKNRFGLMADINKVLYQYASDITYLKAWTSHTNKDADFKIQIKVKDIETIVRIFEELDEIEDVEYIYRIPTKQIYLTLFLVVLLSVLWVLQPFIFSWASSEIIKANDFISSLMLYLWLFVMFVMIMYITSLVRNYLPFVRNKILLWSVAFGMPVVATSTLLIDYVYLGARLNWTVLFFEVLLIYLYLFVSFLNLRQYFK